MISIFDSIPIHSIDEGEKEEEKRERERNIKIERAREIEEGRKREMFVRNILD